MPFGLSVGALEPKPKPVFAGALTGSAGLAPKPKLPPAGGLPAGVVEGWPKAKPLDLFSAAGVEGDAPKVKLEVLADSGALAGSAAEVLGLAPKAKVEFEGSAGFAVSAAFGVDPKEKPVFGGSVFAGAADGAPNENAGVEAPEAGGAADVDPKENFGAGAADSAGLGSSSAGLEEPN